MQISQNEHQQWIRLEIWSKNDSRSALGEGSRFGSYFSGWNNRFWVPEALWAKTDPSNGFASKSHPRYASTRLGPGPMPEELVRVQV